MILGLLKRIVQPSDACKEPELRRRVVALNILMMTYTAFVGAMALLSNFLVFDTARERDQSALVLFVCFAVFSVACLLGKTRYHIVGGLLFTLTIYVGCAVAPFQTDSTATLLLVLPFFIVPTLIGAFLFPLRYALGNIAVGTLLSLGLPFFFGNIDAGTKSVYLIVFNLIVYAILCAGTLLRVWDERQMIEDRLVLIKNSKMKTLGQMSGNIAHEINTPIATIILRATQAKRLLCKEAGLPAPVQEDVVKMLDIIKKTADDIALIVEGLRRFSREDRGLELGPTKLGLVLDHAVVICKEAMQSAGVRLTLLPFDREISVLGSEVQMAQVILNLLSNARHAVKDMDEKWIQIAVTKQLATATVTITDSGSGIPDKIATKIFEPFFTTKQIGDGTGLGLSICYGIVKGMKGKLYVDQQCKNTRFVMELPLVVAA